MRHKYELFAAFSPLEGIYLNVHRIKKNIGFNGAETNCGAPRILVILRTDDQLLHYFTKQCTCMWWAVMFERQFDH